MPVADGGYRPVINPGRNGLDPRLFQTGDDLVGGNPGREVNVVDRQPEQIVAHRAADIARQPLVGAECRQQTLHPALLPPLWRVQDQCHCSRRDRLTIMAAVAPHILRSSHSSS